VGQATEIHANVAGMALFDKLFRNPDGLPPQRKPNGGYGGYPPHLVRSQLQPDEAAELAQLRAERDRLIHAEREAETKLLRLRAELDDASNRLMAEARSTVERSVTMTILEFIGGRLSEWSRSSSEIGSLAALARAFRADRMNQLQQGPAPVENLRQRLGPPPSPTRAVEAVTDHEALARGIVEAGRRAQAPDGVQRPFIVGPRQPRADASDPVRLAEDIVRNGRKNS
jgi:hypothetical protein